MDANVFGQRKQKLIDDQVTSLDTTWSSQKINTDMAALFPPPVWHDLVLQNGFTGTLSCCRIENTIHLRGTITGVLVNERIITALPADFRPHASFSFFSPGSGVAMVPSLLRLQGTGHIIVRNPLPGTTFPATAQTNNIFGLSFVAAN